MWFSNASKVMDYQLDCYTLNCTIILLLTCILHQRAPFYYFLLNFLHLAQNPSALFYSILVDNSLSKKEIFVKKSDKKTWLKLTKLMEKIFGR